VYSANFIYTVGLFRWSLMQFLFTLWMLGSTCCKASRTIYNL